MPDRHYFHQPFPKAPPYKLLFLTSLENPPVLLKGFKMNLNLLLSYIYLYHLLPRT